MGLTSYILQCLHKFAIYFEEPYYNVFLCIINGEMV